jgi:ribosome-interacting GTPase 1
MGIKDEIEQTKEKLEKTPRNKGTEKERGRLKAKIARLEEKLEKKQAGTASTGEGYAVEKTGDATVSLVGYPSVGKSTLLNKLTNADSEVGSYEFTTLEVVPGMMKHRGANIQIVDVPGLIGGAAKGRGDGQQVLSMVRNSDMVVLMTEPDRLDGFEKMREELYDAGIRPDMEPPNIKVTKKGEGGIRVKTPVDLTHIDRETVKEIMQEWGYVNASIVIREDVTLERVIDALARDRVYIPSIKVVNKAEELSEEEARQIEEEHGEITFISAKHEENLEELKDRIFEELGLIRVYLKRKGKEADRNEPLILTEGDTIEDLCNELHDSFRSNFKDARIWGDSADFDGQRVGMEHTVMDEDIVEITKTR